MILIHSYILSFSPVTITFRCLFVYRCPTIIVLLIYFVLFSLTMYNNGRLGSSHTRTDYRGKSEKVGIESQVRAKSTWSNDKIGCNVRVLITLSMLRRFVLSRFQCETTQMVVVRISFDVM